MAEGAEKESEMGFKESFKRALRSIGREAKEKLPGVVGDIAQQTLEAAPMWDQGWASRVQGNQTARNIQVAVQERAPVNPEQAPPAEQTLQSIDQHMAALLKAQAEANQREQQRDQDARMAKAEAAIRNTQKKPPRRGGRSR